MELTQLKQRIFTKILKGLKKQQWRKSTDEIDRYCVYISSNGDRCAIGHLIPKGKESEVEESLNEHCIDDLIEAGGLPPRYSKVDYFLGLMQNWHDSYMGVDDAGNLQEVAIGRLRYIATQNGVCIPEGIL